VSADLTALNRSTERDFLEIGGRLAGVQQTTRRLSADLAELTVLFSGEQGKEAVDSLVRMQRHAAVMSAGCAERGGVLAKIREQSREVRAAFAGLRGTVKLFRGLCSLTRIETARLAGAGSGFIDLADEVGTLSARIQERGDEIFEALRQLDSAAHFALRSGGDLRERQSRELPSLTAAALDGLRCFQERQQRAHAASLVHRSQSEEVCAAIDQLVLAVQAHDITRQQIEHVVAALEGLGGTPATQPGRGLPGEVQAALALQRMQLASAGSQFAEAVERIETSLAGIGSRVRDMAEESRALMGGSSEEHDSFFLRIEGCFTAILRALNQCDRAERDMRLRAGELAGGTGRMRQAVKEIRAIEIEIQRIGLNAVIQATHIGSGGTSLDLIAGVMHRLAMESAENTERAAGLLDAIAAAVGELQGAAGGGTGESGLMEELRSGVLRVHSASESAFSRVHGIAALSSGLAEDIGGMAANFSAGRMFAGAVARACGQLERMVQAAEPSASIPAQPLEHLERNYTMQREREVHRQMAESAAGAPVSVPETDREEESLGENVELF